MNRHRARKDSNNGDSPKFGEAPSQEMLAKLPTLAEANIPGRDN